MSSLSRYFEVGRAAGCPRDQMRNYAVANTVLQPRQLAMAAAARECDKPDGPVMVGVGGARGGGKTHWAFAQMGADDCQRYPGLKFLYLRKVMKSAREAFSDVFPRVYGGLAHEYKAHEGVLKFDNGSRVILGHFKNESDIDAYLGIEYDAAVIEEATTLSNAKMRSIRSVVRTSKDGWRPRIYFTTNPGGIGHAWFKRMFIESFRKGEQTETRFIPATIDDNAFVNPEYRKTLDSYTGWLLKAWRYGDWDIEAGQFFTNFRADIHVVKPLEYIPIDWTLWGGLDYGFTHYTAYVAGAMDNEGNIYALGEHAEAKKLPEFHAQSIRGLWGRMGVGMDRVRATYGGSDFFSKIRSDVTIAAEYEQNGIVIQRANVDRVAGAGRILQLLGDAERQIRPRLFISSNCIRTIEALQAMQHDPNRPEDVLKTNMDEDGEGGDDLYDALRYMVMSAGYGGGNFEV